MSSSTPSLPQSILSALSISHGHFLYESSHHGDLWLDLASLFTRPARTTLWCSALAAHARPCNADTICGPLTGGAFLAQSLAATMHADFAYAERTISPTGGLQYCIPDSLRASLHSRRILLVDDVVNAGAALLATLADLRACNAEVVALASLVALGDAATRISAAHNLPFHTLATLDRNLWSADSCPLCAAGIPLATPPATG